MARASTYAHKSIIKIRRFHEGDTHTHTRMFRLHRHLYLGSRRTYGASANPRAALKSTSSICHHHRAPLIAAIIANLPRSTRFVRRPCVRRPPCAARDILHSLLAFGNVNVSETGRARETTGERNRWRDTTRALSHVRVCSSAPITSMMRARHETNVNRDSTFLLSREETRICGFAEGISNNWIPNDWILNK